MGFSNWVKRQAARLERMAGKVPKADLDLVDAVRKGDADRVGRLMEEGLASLKGPLGRPFEKTGLMYAAEWGSTECVRLLLPVSDPGAMNEGGGSALHLAAAMGNEEVVRLLLPESDANLRDKGGMTPLMMAAVHGWDGCVEALLPVSDLDAKNLDGLTAREAAEMAGEWKAAETIGGFARVDREARELGVIGAKAGMPGNRGPSSL